MTPSPETAGVSDAASAGETVADGRYVIMGSLGAGSQGETLEAVDKREGRPVAIKRFTIRGAKTWKDVELAEREATVLASLSHPGLPRYIEHLEENGALYLVMEKIEGETLQTRRKRGAGLDQAQVTRFLRDAGACLHYLHSQAPPVVHRDIKPGNVILRPDGSYCLVDFGSVRDRQKPEGGSTVVGTFGFMAPEQFQGRAAPGSDVYAVGATALSLLTGREPEDLPHKGLGIDVEAALRGQIDRKLIAALRSMLEPDPDRRARSVEDALRLAGLKTGDSAGQSSESAGSAQAAKRARRERLAEDSHQRAWGRADDHRSRNEERLRESFERHQERIARKHTERAERRARKAEQRAQRHARRYARDWQRPGPPVPPGRVLAFFILLALGIAGAGTFALFQVLLPTLFTILGLSDRRRRMLQIGEAGHNGLALAREHIRYKFLGGPLPSSMENFLRDNGRDPFGDEPSFMHDPAESPFKARVDTTPPAHQRVSIGTEDEDEAPEHPSPKRSDR